ncbi:response regulator, partial [Candidatus Dependentiae bacterium]|nr:response regulator [Candidatus Dependentiae bacterium]
SEINEMLASLESSEKIVKENQIWFKTIFETVQTGDVLVEKNTHKIIDANPVAVKMIGTEKENIVGHICHKFICPADFGKCPVTDLHMEIDNSERELITDKNEKIPILKTVVSINLGNKDYLLETFSDITKLKNAEASMKAAKESAEEANIAKSRFLANMSHEIRTPLNSIIGFTEILMEEQLSLDQREHINLIHSSSETLMNLINDILDISKIEANKIEFEEIEFDLDKIIYETIDIFRSKLNQKPIEFIFNTEEIENLLIGDPVRIKQILMNLLSNAIKFTEKGEIELSLKKISESSEILNIEIAVRDTGIGIPEDKLNLIFEPFKQVDSSTTRKFGGTGLGLNIVKKIIEFMKGKIILESRLNEGSKFVITLPMKKSERNILNSVQYAEGLIGLEIVCVDDNKSNRIILENMLKKMGVIPSLFESAKKMIEYLESIDCLPKVAVIDIMMPEMDGYKVAAEIRKKYGNKIKLIGLSSQGNILETDDPAEILFDGFLNKPIKKIVLINAIKLCLYGEGDKPAGIITEQYIDQNSINKKINILVAEDIQANRKFIDVLLKKMGLSADFAENGIQAVDMASKKKYDIIFMDIQMPEMDGIEASKRIRMKEVETPIIALTANAMKGDKEICLQSGMNDYMTKPIKKDVFYKMLSKWTNIVPDYMKPQRVLIIENNSVLINILKFAILDAYPEISVKTAENGLTGASMISGFLPDIVISGSSVSGMNNDELITLINSDKRFENISIIICSDLANKNNDSYKKLSENYFVELLIPPFNRNEIVRTVNKVLKKKFFKTNGIQIGKDEEKTIEIESQENEKMFERWMKTAGGDPDFEQIIIDFLMEIPKYIEQLEKLIAQKDLDEIKKIAHSMKGSSGTMGAKELYEQFLKIDMECKTSKSIDKIAESLQEIKKVMNMIPKKYFQ